jgi:hypothetical protein
MLDQQIVKALVEICRQHEDALFGRYLALSTTQLMLNFFALLDLSTKSGCIAIASQILEQVLNVNVKLFIVMGLAASKLLCSKL